MKSHTMDVLILNRYYVELIYKLLCPNQRIILNKYTKQLDYELDISIAW